MEYKNIIDLSGSDWGKQDFMQELEKVRKRFVWTLANTSPDHEDSPRLIGSCLQFLEHLMEADFIDQRTQP